MSLIVRKRFLIGNDVSPPSPRTASGKNQPMNAVAMNRRTALPQTATHMTSLGRNLMGQRQEMGDGHIGQPFRPEFDYSPGSFGRGSNSIYGSTSNMTRGMPADNGAAFDFSSSNAGLDDDDEYLDEDEEDAQIARGMFVSEENRTQSSRQPSQRNPQSGRGMLPGDLNRSSPQDTPSRPRSSGVHKRPNVNVAPPTVPTDSISDASLLKRGLQRSRDHVMSKRSQGPTDPENVLIVKLRENEKKSWGDISEILNNRRISEGKSPQFTPNGCHNRYNRNAPIILEAEGKEFIPVHIQRKMAKNPKGAMQWDDEMDTLLIQAVKEVDAQKWTRVADLFNKFTGRTITASEAALRTKVI